MRFVLVVSMVGASFRVGVGEQVMAGDRRSAVETAPEVGLRADAKPACAGWGAARVCRVGTVPVREHIF